MAQMPEQLRNRRRRQCAAMIASTITAQPSLSPLPPPSLMEELVEEILLRLPAQEPASLVRAALVCKPWRRLVSSARFRRRYLEFHRRAPPLLGFICNYDYTGGSTFVRATASSPLREDHVIRWWMWCALDARHGRVLLRPPDLRVPVLVLVVWDPITDEQWELPALPRSTESCTAAVLCAGAGACNHHACQCGPFRVVFVGTEPGKRFICTYSSDVGAWSKPISFSLQHFHARHTISGGYSPSVLLGNELYFGIEGKNAALRYDLEQHDMLWIHLPFLEFGLQSSVLTTTDDGELGLVRLLGGVLRIWRLRMNASKTSGRWIQFKVVDLRTLMLDVRCHSFIPKASVVGFADGLGVVFVMVKDAHYTVDLKTYVVKKQVYNGREVDTVIPYMQFYPALEAATSGAEEEPSAAGSSA